MSGENDDADVDINLLSELLELAENDDKQDGFSESTVSCVNPGSFDSVLEKLDSMPLSRSSRSKPASKFGILQQQNGEQASAIHTGDTDSSDDEDARKFGSGSDSFGSSVKRMLKTAEEEKRSGPRLTDFKGPVSRVPDWKSQSTSTTSLSLPVQKKNSSMDVYTDSSIGIRIVNPLVSSTVLKERLVGRKVVPMSQVKQFTSDGKVTDDWVIFGAIVSKALPRTSAKGTLYSIIKLSDLRGPGNPRMVSLFLFSGAFKKHGKDSVGTVLGILNPGILENSRNHGDEACLSVDNPDRIMVLGTSKDFGLCKSKKKNGDDCTAVVNLAHCEYCVYHVKQEYQKCSRRSDIQSSFNGPGLTNLRNKVLGKNEVFYGGQSFSAIPAQKSKKLVERDQNRLMKLSGKLSLEKLSTSKTGIATSLDVGKRQTQKDIDRLRKLTNDDAKFLSKPLTSNPVTAPQSCDEIKPEDAKQAALAVIAKKKCASVSESIAMKDVPQRTASDFSDNSDVPVMAENQSALTNSRGILVTLALNTDKKAIAHVTPSSLGLGLSSQSDQGKGNLTVSSEKLTTKSTVQGQLKQDVDRKPKPSSIISVNKKSEKPSLSSDQLRKLANSGMDFESRMLRQAAQKAALEEEAAKLDANVTPSMLGLGRQSILVRGKSIAEVTPKLGKGLSSSTVDLSMPIQRKLSSSAKLSAINLIKSQGGISKTDPNIRDFESRKKSIKENKIDNKRSHEDSSSFSASAPKKFKQSPPDQTELETEAKKARFKELMEIKSRHTDLIEAAEDEAQETYFGKLEKKEQMEEKMLNTFKMACKAVRCLTCKYTSFSASEKCKTERHPLKVFDATKRFFKCSDCGNRTVSLQVIPLTSCSNCASSRWERAPMIRERKVGVSQEILSVRGMEETFIGTVTTGANVNLLIPEEGT